MKPGRVPQVKWMGISKVVKAQGYKSELSKKYGSIKMFCKIAGLSYAPFNDFLNGRHYWCKRFADACEQYLNGDKKYVLPDLAYKPELDKLRSEIKMLWGSTKAMCEQAGFVDKQDVYSLMSNMSKARKKGRIYWQIRAAIAEKKLEVVKTGKNDAAILKQTSPEGIAGDAAFNQLYPKHENTIQR